MKTFFVLLTLLAKVAVAGELGVKCQFTDITYRNQFSLDATSVILEENQFFNTAFDFELRKAGPSAKIDRMSITRDGFIKIFEAGTIGQKRSIQLASVIKGADVELINLLLDYPGPLTSQIRFLDGTTFFSTCRSL